MALFDKKYASLMDERKPLGQNRQEAAWSLSSFYI
jgi:hypothetical protein